MFPSFFFTFKPVIFNVGLHMVQTMKSFLFIILAGCAVKCEDNGYYVIEIPSRPDTRFQVYWNVPTMQCSSKGIHFDDLHQKYGIIQNKDDTFRGSQVAILYDPGLFPAIFKNETIGTLRFRNGGVPQEGDLEEHLEAFKRNLNQSVSEMDSDGVGIIDFESWRPTFRQNFGVLRTYQNVSYAVEMRKHWWWPRSWIEDEARRRFEEAAKLFMNSTLALARAMRPNAAWGYYGFPYCFNMRPDDMTQQCAPKVLEENDDLQWLWDESTALYPSLYSSKDLTSSQLADLIKGRVNEAERVKRKDAKILPYFWFRYRDGGFLYPKDLSVALQTLSQSNASGFIIWGSSNDVNTKQKCRRLLNYLENTMGPAIANYTMLSTNNDFVTTKINNTTPTILREEITESYNKYEDEIYEHNISENKTVLKENNNVLIQMLLNVLNDTKYTTTTDIPMKIEVINNLVTKNPFEMKQNNSTFSNNLVYETTSESTNNYMSTSESSSTSKQYDRDIINDDQIYDFDSEETTPSNLNTTSDDYFNINDERTYTDTTTEDVNTDNMQRYDINSSNEFNIDNSTESTTYRDVESSTLEQVVVNVS